MASDTLSDHNQQSERMYEDIQPTYEYRIGTKQQLQECGIGWGAAFPGEPGANKRRSRLLDRRGYSVSVELQRPMSPGSQPRYRAFTKIPHEVINRREYTRQLSARETCMVDLLREHADSVGNQMFACALSISINTHAQRADPNPMFSEGDTVNANHFWIKGLGKVKSVKWRAAPEHGLKTGWLYEIIIGNDTHTLLEHDLQKPRSAEVIAMPNAAAEPVKQRRRGRIPKDIPRIGRA